MAARYPLTHNAASPDDLASALATEAPSSSAAETPRPLAAGDQVELWLQLVPPDAWTSTLAAPTAASAEAASANSALSEDAGDWDVRPARVAAQEGPFIAVLAGNWQLDAAPETHAMIRRSGADGVAEWDAALVDPLANAEAGLLAARVARDGFQGRHETVTLLRVAPEGAAGRLYQRRRSPRLPLRLRAVRLIPLPSSGANPDEGDEGDGIAPVARLTDVSATGAGVVVDYPLSAGTTVALEFDLPGEIEPFEVRGRVVEPAVPLHGASQPQPDGLPGFRRGIEFLGNAAGRESRRLASTLSSLAQRRPQ